MSEVREVPAERILDQLTGAQIVFSYVEDENGLHLQFADGRALVIAGYFAISIVGKPEDVH